MENNNLLYTIRNWYENQSKTGIMITLTAKDKGQYYTVKGYIPYRSNYEGNPTAEKLLNINSLEECARITIFKKREFED